MGLILPLTDLSTKIIARSELSNCLLNIIKTVICTKCQKVSNVPDSYIGSRIKCEHCCAYFTAIDGSAVIKAARKEKLNKRLKMEIKPIWLMIACYNYHFMLIFISGQAFFY